jgi:hypothetical protein
MRKQIKQAYLLLFVLGLFLVGTECLFVDYTHHPISSHQQSTDILNHSDNFHHYESEDHLIVCDSKTKGKNDLFNIDNFIDINVSFYNNYFSIIWQPPKL